MICHQCAPQVSISSDQQNLMKTYHNEANMKLILKSLQNKKDLNDFTAARFLVVFFAAGS